MTYVICKHSYDYDYDYDTIILIFFLFFYSYTDISKDVIRNLEPICQTKRNAPFLFKIIK